MQAARVLVEQRAVLITLLRDLLQQQVSSAGLLSTSWPHVACSSCVLLKLLPRLWATKKVDKGTPLNMQPGAGVSAGGHAGGPADQQGQAARRDDSSATLTSRAPAR